MRMLGAALVSALALPAAAQTHGPEPALDYPRVVLALVLAAAGRAGILEAGVGDYAEVLLTGAQP